MLSTRGGGAGDGAASDRRTGRRAGRSGHPGASVLRLAVGLTAFGAVTGVTLGFVTSQSGASPTSTSVERMGALGNARSALSAVSRDLETLGASGSARGPALLYGDAQVVVFSADPTTDAAEDLSAALREAGARADGSWVPALALAAPHTAHTAPGSNAPTTPEASSPVELLTFLFLPDTLTERSDDFIFVRQVNGEPPEVVARHLHRADGAPFFAFGAAAAGNEARALRITVRGSNGLLGEDERTVDASRLLSLSDLGLATGHGAIVAPAADG